MKKLRFLLILLTILSILVASGAFLLLHLNSDKARIADLSKENKIKVLNSQYDDNEKLTELKLMTTSAILDLSGFEALKKLDISNSSNLQAVNVSGSNLSELTLAKLPAMSELILRKNGKQQSTLNLVLMYIKKAKNLVMQEADQFPDNAELNKVEIVDLGNLAILDLHDLDIETLTLVKTPNLTDLNLKGNKKLANLNLKKLLKLARLDAQQCNLSKIRIPKLPELVKLNLSQNEKLTHISFYRQYPKLTTLNLEQCDLSKIKLPKLPVLVELNLGKNKKLSGITLKNYPKLAKVNLDSCDINKLVLARLTKLTELSILKNSKLPNLELTEFASLAKLSFDPYDSRIENVSFHPKNKAFPKVAVIEYTRDEKSRVLSEEFLDVDDNYVNCPGKDYAIKSYSYANGKRKTKKALDSGEAQKEREDDIKLSFGLEEVTFSPISEKIYPSQINTRKLPVIGIIEVKNPLQEKIYINAKLSSKQFQSIYDTNTIRIGKKISLGPLEKKQLRVYLPFSSKLWENSNDQIIKADLEMKGKSFESRKRARPHKENIVFSLMSVNKITWDDIRNIAPYGSMDDPVIVKLAQQVENLNKLKNTGMPSVIFRPLAAYELLRSIKLNYSSMSRGSEDDNIKTPSDIIKDKTGKCTDTTIIYGSLLQKLGFSVIVTTFSYKKGNERISHLMLLIDTGLDAKDWRFLHNDKNKIVTLGPKSRCYIPIETTALTSGIGSDSSDFLRAWDKGIVQIRKHKRQILNPENTFRLDTAWAKGFTPIKFTTKKEMKLPLTEDEKITMQNTIKELNAKYIQEYLISQKELAQLQKKLNNKDYQSVFNLANYLFTVRRFIEAKPYFQTALRLQSENPVPYYYYCAVVIYMALSNDPKVDAKQKEAAKKEFLKFGGKFSQILIRKNLKISVKEQWFMNYDLGKWFSAVGNRKKSEIHDKLAREAQAKMNQQKKLIYSKETISKLKAEKFSDQLISYLQKKNIEATTILDLLKKGLNVQLISILAGSGLNNSVLKQLIVKELNDKAVVKHLRELDKKYIKDSNEMAIKKLGNKDNLVIFKKAKSNKLIVVAVIPKDALEKAKVSSEVKSAKKQSLATKGIGNNEQSSKSVKGLAESDETSMPVKGFSESDEVASAVKGFSESDEVASAVKGFSESDEVASAVKGFSEDDSVASAAKGFSEEDSVSSASKGYSEEAWSLSK